MTKKQRTEEVRAILHSYKPGDIINNQQDAEYLMNLFPSHPEWEIKEGVGIRCIGVDTGQYGTKHFVLFRIDGTSTDISFVQCINGKTTPISDIKVACRQAIRPLMDDYKRTRFINGVTRCEVTNEVLSSENAHVDHYKLTFNELFKNWIFTKSIDVLFNKLNDRTIDHEKRIFFTDEAIVADFIAYHNANTHLRFVSEFANLSLLKRKQNYTIDDSTKKK